MCACVNTGEKYIQGGDSKRENVLHSKPLNVECMHSFERLHLFRGSCTFEPDLVLNCFASCVEPLPLLEGLALFELCYWCWALSASSWGLAVFYLVTSSRCPCLWGPSFCKFCSFEITLFWLFIGFWSFGWVLFFFLLPLFLLLSCCVLVLTMHSSRGRLRTHGWYVPMWFVCDEWLSMGVASWVEFGN